VSIRATGRPLAVHLLRPILAEEHVDVQPDYLAAVRARDRGIELFGAACDLPGEPCRVRDAAGCLPGTLPMVTITPNVNQQNEDGVKDFRPVGPSGSRCRG